MQSYAFSKQDLTKDLEKIGLRKGDVVLVHSSLSRIGYVPGGAETAIGALLEAVGEGGTIVVPTITGSISDSPENPPSFAKDKPSWTGSVPEALRKMRGAFRSKHPTHSVASVGNLAGKITRGHEAALTPCGKGTPYVRVAEEEGKILFIGTTLECNTTFHSCEELARLYYHLQPEPTTCEIEEDGRIVKRRMFLHAYGTPRAFAEKERDLVGSGIAKVGLVGRARSVLVDARKMIDYAMQRLERDRLYLVQKGSVSFGCIEECVEFLRKGKCRSMRINLYLPRKGSLAFSGNRLKFSGMDVSFSGNLRLESGLLRLRLGVAKGVKLEGGYNYWLRFGRKRGKLEVEILDRAEPHSQAKTRLK